MGVTSGLLTRAHAGPRAPGRRGRQRSLTGCSWRDEDDVTHACARGLRSRRGQGSWCTAQRSSWASQGSRRELVAGTGGVTGERGRRCSFDPGGEDDPSEAGLGRERRWAGMAWAGAGQKRRGGKRAGQGLGRRRKIGQVGREEMGLAQREMG